MIRDGRNRRTGADRYLVLALALVTTMVLSGCTSTKLADAGDPSPADTSTLGIFGTGPYAVGVLAFEEPDNLSDGAPDSIALAAQLAAGTVKGGGITVMVRDVGAQSQNLGPALTDLETLGPGIVIGTAVARDAADTAKIMAAKDVPTISLTSYSDLAVQLYAAAFVPNEEAVAMVNELARRGTRNVAIVSSSGEVSQKYTALVIGLAGAAGVSVRPIDGSTESQFLAALAANQSAGVSLDAIVFAIGPDRAAAMVKLASEAGLMANLTVVGNSGWAVLPALPASLKGAWYPAPENNTLPEFATKFREAFGSYPTLNAALVYDLLVLAGALPSIQSDDPYQAELLTASQGFGGFTGTFRFGPTGMAGARNYAIVAN
jgi:ABC-type branched-subunit amino acid transport system substrate-binding protein